MNLWPFKNHKSRRELEGELAIALATLQNSRDCHEKTVQKLTDAQKMNADWDACCEGYEKKISELESQPKPQVKVEVVQSLNLTLAKWLKEENLIASAANLLKHPDLRAMLDVLRNEHPAIKGIALGTPIDQRAVFQARGEGYQLCLNNLLAMGEKPKKKTEIEETWGTEKEK